ncbi:hypothetical protein EXS62_02265 [Candidatus Kaiserbacteria bacterium]|nr:hypothetical protein [Candidatus Kaiserbacteria bacterium]
MANIQQLADTAAKHLCASTDKSDLRFFTVTTQVVRGSGISNASDLSRIASQVRSELRQRSARHRRAVAAQRVAS